MTTMVIIKDETGKLNGLGKRDQKAYARFRKLIQKLESGEIFTLNFWFPRNRKLHGLYFVMLTQVLNAQEQFDDVDKLRCWLTVGAGDCEFYPGPNGRIVAIPKSINFQSMDDEEFGDHLKRVKEFLRSDRAQLFLWPHLKPMQASEIVEGLLQGFER